MSGSKPYRALVVDDHRMFRQALISLLATRADLVTVAGQAENGAQALTLARQLVPDIILLDLALPDGNGIELIPALRVGSPHSAIVILSASKNPDQICEAMLAGADGYLTKDLDASTLFDMFDFAAAGQIAMTRKVATLFAREIAKRAQEYREAERERVLQSFDELDHAIIQYVARGATNLEIARALNISAHTVKLRLTHILETCKLDNRTQIAVFFNANYPQLVV